MTTSPEPQILPLDPWPDAQRIESFAGEIRVNRIRLIALIVFYARHLADVYLARSAPAIGAYHARVTVIVLAWALMAAWLHWMLARRRFDPAIKYFAVVWDAAMITLLAMSGLGPKGPLVLLYFPLIASASLRLSLKLVWTATLISAGCYCLLLMNYPWRQIGWDRYYATPELRIPRSTEGIFLLALGATGLFAGQFIRQARRIASGYPVSAAQESGK